MALQPKRAVANGPAEGEKMQEELLTAIDKLLETGKLLEFASSQTDSEGLHLEGESKDMFRIVGAIGYFILFEPHEMIPYETGKEIMRELFKEQAKAMKQ